jgi:hypothetical protein
MVFLYVNMSKKNYTCKYKYHNIMVYILDTNASKKIYTCTIYKMLVDIFLVDIMQIIFFVFCEVKYK